MGFNFRDALEDARRDRRVPWINHSTAVGLLVGACIGAVAHLRDFGVGWVLLILVGAWQLCAGAVGYAMFAADRRREQETIAKLEAESAGYALEWQNLPLPPDAASWVCERCGVKIDGRDHVRFRMTRRHATEAPDFSTPEGRLCKPCGEWYGEAIFEFARIHGLSAMRETPGGVEWVNGLDEPRRGGRGRVESPAVVVGDACDNCCCPTSVRTTDATDARNVPTMPAPAPDDETCNEREPS